MIELLVSYSDPWLAGVTRTIVYTAAAFLLAFAFGTVLAVLAVEDRRMRAIANQVSDFVVTTPPVVQLFFIFFVLPSFGINIPALATGLGCLGVHYGCYIYRTLLAGLDGLPRGQTDAAAALGIRPWQAFILVRFPQAVLPFIPVYGNYAILLLKETALLSVITIPELFAVTMDEASRTFRYFELLTVLGLTYLIITHLIARTSETLYARLWTRTK